MAAAERPKTAARLNATPRRWGSWDFLKNPLDMDDKECIIKAHKENDHDNR